MFRPGALVVNGLVFVDTGWPRGISGVADGILDLATDFLNLALDLLGTAWCAEHEAGAEGWQCN